MPKFNFPYQSLQIWLFFFHGGVSNLEQTNSIGIWINRTRPLWRVQTRGASHRLKSHQLPVNVVPLQLNNERNTSTRHIQNHGFDIGIFKWSSTGKPELSTTNASMYITLQNLPDDHRIWKALIQGVPSSSGADDVALNASKQCFPLPPLPEEEAQRHWTVPEKFVGCSGGGGDGWVLEWGKFFKFTIVHGIGFSNFETIEGLKSNYHFAKVRLLMVRDMRRGLKLNLF